jgi:acetolactate synthase-1/2/3 large subunit
LRAPRFAGNLKVIQVDVNPAELGHNRPVDVPIAGDARAVLQQLVDEAKGKIEPAATRPGRRGSARSTTTSSSR